jgi:hypothetical protein
MDLLQWARERNEAMTIWDTGLLKVMAMLFGMVVGGRLATHMRRYQGVYVALSAVFAVVVTFRWFTARTPR